MAGGAGSLSGRLSRPADAAVVPRLRDRRRRGGARRQRRPADRAARRRGGPHGPRHCRDALYRHGDPARLRANGRFRASRRRERGGGDRRLSIGVVARLRRGLVFAGAVRGRARSRHFRHALHRDDGTLAGRHRRPSSRADSCCCSCPERVPQAAEAAVAARTAPPGDSAAAPAATVDPGFGAFSLGGAGSPPRRPPTSPSSATASSTTCRSMRSSRPTQTRITQ